MIVPGRRYGFEELRRLRTRPEAKAWEARGYHWSYNLDGTASLVHWTQVPGTAGRAPRGITATFDSDPFPLEPIRRRTPAERRESLIGRFAEDLKAGRVLSADDLSTIAAQSWRRGEPVTGEALTAVASHFLGEAEKRNEEEQGRHVVRTAPSD